MPSSAKMSRMLCSAQGFVSNDGRERILHTSPLGIPWDWVWEQFLRDGRPVPRNSSGEHPGVLVQTQPGTHSPIPWGHSGCHHGCPLPHRQWGAHTSHPTNLLPAMKWMITHLDAPKLWVPFFLDAHPISGGGHLYVLPPTYPPTWTSLTAGCPQILSAASSWMLLPSGCSAHMWMPPFLDDTWVSRTHGCSPIPVPNTSSAIPLPQSRVPPPMSGATPPDSLSHHAPLPQGTPGAVVLRRPAVRWPCPLSSQGRVGAGHF